MDEKAEVTETPLEAELVERVEREPSLEPSPRSTTSKPTLELDRIDQLRAAVEITRDAVHAVSITAHELVGEAAAFMGVIGKQGELLNPFEDIDAPIWAEEEVPPEMLEAAYAYCEELTKREAGNFYHSFKYLPDDKRLAMCAYYAFCRRADDIADGDFVDVFPGSTGADDPEAITYRKQLEELTGDKSVLDSDTYRDKLAQLFFFRKKLSTAYSAYSSTDPVFMALKDVVTRYDIPRVYMDDLISGMEDDLYTNRYQTFDDLYRYCYRVASVVGLTCVEICGYEDDAAREFAEAWGIFMQLTNILRDVVEDAERNRVYLPLDELKKHGIDSDELSEDLSDDLRWKAFVSDFIGRAESYYFRAQQLLPLLDRSSRYSPAAMMAFYRSVLKKIKKRDGDVFHGTVKLSKAEKMTLAALVYTKQRFLRL
jgi:phytoene synthase